jgi:peptidoglycan hydrolase CwlO-like protein
MISGAQGGAVNSAIIAAVLSATAVVIVGLLSWLSQRNQVRVTGSVSATDVAIDGLDRLVNNLQEELSTKRDELHDALTRCSACEKQMQDMQAELGRKDAELDDFQSRLLSAQEEIRTLRKKLLREGNKE